MNFDQQLELLDEEEQKLITEMDFFNHNVEWWSNEFNRVTQKLQDYERRRFEGVSETETDNLVLAMQYLVGKTEVERKTAENIDKRLHKLALARELVFIQGNYNHDPGCHKHIPIPATQQTKKKLNIRNRN